MSNPIPGIEGSFDDYLEFVFPNKSDQERMAIKRRIRKKLQQTNFTSSKEFIGHVNPVVKLACGLLGIVYSEVLQRFIKDSKAVQDIIRSHGQKYAINPALKFTHDPSWFEITDTQTKIMLKHPKHFKYMLNQMNIASHRMEEETLCIWIHSVNVVDGKIELQLASGVLKPEEITVQT